MVEARPRNPYIIGSPINDERNFFGRESLFRFIEDNLYQGVKVILLHGQRRIGKSSVLRQIPNFVGNNEFVFISFDLEHRGQSHFSHILHDLCREIVDQLQIDPNPIKIPTAEEIDNDQRIFTHIFLSRIFKLINGNKIVFLLDEFDVVNNKNSSLTTQNLDFFDYLARLVRQQENLFIIPVVGRSLDDMPNLLNLFKEAPYQEIGLLDDLSAKRLITKPSEGILTYEQEAIQEILRLSAGHPYFTQVICFTIFLQAREQSNWNITRADVRNIVERIFHDDNAQAGLAWFWDGLPIAEKVVFSAVAEAQKNIANSQDKQFPEEPLTLLMKYGVIPTDHLIQAAQRLSEKGFLDDTKRRIKVELVCYWLVQKHSLCREICELEKLEQENIKQLFKVASNLYLQNHKQNALELYNQILAINPNHFQTILELAQVYLEIGNFDQALELYERAYQFDPIRNKDRLLHALQDYGHSLLTQKNFVRARQQYERVLEIEPHRSSAQNRLTEIAIFQENTSPVNPAHRVRQKQSIKVLLAAGIVVAIAIPTVSLVYRFLSPCPVGQQEQLGIFCVADTNRISRGDRTFFPEIQNPNRDRGIQAFEKGKYKDAAEFFKKAVEDNRNDPEVLIYYNNALARQQSSPLTLAVAVPAGEKKEQKAQAQEILRGVAQAQRYFNEKDGFYGQLLEIVIANDADDKQQAQQVAAKLAKDTSILGVIGHNSSDATRKALGEYEKAGLPIISSTSTSTLLKSYVFFRTPPSDAAAGKKLADYAFTKLKLKKVVIFANPDSPYSISLTIAFTNQFKQLGGEVVRKQLIDITSPTLNVNQEVSDSVLIYQAQAAMLFPDTQHTHIALEVAAASKKLMDKFPNSDKKRFILLAGDSMYSNETLRVGKNAVKDLVVAVPWFREAAKAQDFSQKAINQWGGHISWRTATSFDATMAFIQSFSQNPSRTTIIQRLKNVNLDESETSGYPLKFQEGERLNNYPILVKVKGDKFVEVKDN
ncbi:MAG: ABC transporter substrate-binding protein [Calothrix sp. MO_167.B12]|nr:ABC transporter substrate-binding protein [Calothrix sp. MO_167.B12]